MANVKMVKEKNRMSELIGWEAYVKLMESRIAEVKEDIKTLTENEREVLKEYRSDLKAAQWMINKTLGEIKDQLKDGNSITGPITLDDFDVENSSIDIGLAKSMMRQEKKLEEDE